MAGDYSWPSVVTLDSKDYVVDGPVIVQPAEDWAIGIRQGSPTYESREHAFFKSFESFEGGVGLEYGDAREHPDRMWASVGVRTFESAKNITLGPLVTTSALPSQPSSQTGGAFAVYEEGGSIKFWFGAGDKLYNKTDKNAWAAEVVAMHASDRVLDLTPFRDDNNVVNLMMAVGGQEAYWMKTGGGGWSQPTSGDGVSSNGWSFEKADDFLPFDDKILKMFFGEIQMSTDGATWVDIVAVPGNTAFQAFFVGVGLNGAGELAPYAVAEGKLYVIDVWTNQRQEIDLGFGNTIIAATVWQDGEVVVTDGFEVAAYHPDRPVRNMGFNRDHGLASDNLGYIKSFFVVQGKYLCAAVDDGTNMQLFVWVGGAWHNLTADVAGTYSGQGVCLGLNPGSSFFSSTAQDLYISTVSGGSVVTYYVDTDYFKHPKLNANHKYAASGYVITTDFDGGFAEVPGTAIECEIFASDLTANETVQVEYALNGGSSYTSLGTFNGSTTRLKWASGAGIEFKSIRFRFTLARGGTNTNSPVVHAIVFKYLKVPAVRRRVSFTVNTEQSGRQRDPNKTPEEILDELYALVAATTLKTLTWVGEGTYYVKVITMPRTDLMEAKATPAKISHLRVECVEPVEA